MVSFECFHTIRFPAFFFGAQGKGWVTGNRGSELRRMEHESLGSDAEEHGGIQDVRDVAGFTEEM